MQKELIKQAVDEKEDIENQDIFSAGNSKTFNKNPEVKKEDFRYLFFKFNRI